MTTNAQAALIAAASSMDWPNGTHAATIKGLAGDFKQWLDAQDEAERAAQRERDTAALFPPPPRVDPAAFLP